MLSTSCHNASLITCITCHIRVESGTHPSLEGAETSLARPDHLASSISNLIEQLLTVE